MPAKGQKISADHIQKLAEGRKKKGYAAHSPEAKEKMSTAKLGSKQPEAQTQKRSDSMKASHAQRTPEERAAINAKISASKRAKPHMYTDEQKIKMAAAQVAYNATLSYETRLEHMQAAHDAAKLADPRVTNTSIERFIANFLTQAGVRFEQQYKAGPFNVDFYLPDINTVIEANGCYWHKCEKCGFNDDPDKKRLSDKRRYGALVERGYKVRVIWEHDINKGILHYLINLL